MSSNAKPLGSLRASVPALTTIRMPRYEMGRRAAELLCQRLAGATVKTKRLDLGFEVVRRATM